MMRQLRVHFTIGDQINWAVDEDLSLIKQAAHGLVIETDFRTADVVFAAWWAPLLDMHPKDLAHKTVICSMHGDPERFLATPAHAGVFDLVDIWLARSKTAAVKLNKLGFKAIYIPYAFNESVFTQLKQSDPALSNMRSELGNTNGKYLIGNFMRDSEGFNLNKPKLVKGPDMLMEILLECHKQNLPVLPILAGPRRHWLRDQLQTAGIDYIFIGTVLDRDDLSTNTLNRKKLNLIYNLLDLTIISSRSEGGPLAVCEATAAGCKMIATRVGMVPDVLGDKSIFSTVRQAVDLIVQDIKNHTLDVELHEARHRLAANHSIKAMRDKLELLFRTIKVNDFYQDILHYTFNLYSRKLKRKLSQFLVNSRPQAAVQNLYTLTTGSQIWREDRLHQHINFSNSFSISDASDADVVLLSLPSIQSINEIPNIEDKKIAILAENPPEFRQAGVSLDTLQFICNLPGFIGVIFPSQAALTQWTRKNLPISRPVLSFPPLPFYESQPIANVSIANPRHLLLIKGMNSSYDLSSDIDIETNYTLHYLDYGLSNLSQEFSQKRGIFIETNTDEAALSRIRLARMLRIPMVYKKSADSSAIVQFGGVGFSDWPSLKDALDLVARDFESFLRLGQIDPEIGVSLAETLTLLTENSYKQRQGL